MGELSKRADVLALSYHVDYWDGLGWKDTYGSPNYTARQQQYAAVRGFRVYTPQLVVEGSRDLVGSDRSSVLSKIEEAHTVLVHAQISLVRKPGQKLEINIGQTPLIKSAASGEVMVVSFDAKNETTVKAGENAGRQLAYYNVVRSIRKIGSWNNQALHLTESLTSDENGRSVAVFVQAADGTVWAVAASSVLSHS